MNRLTRARIAAALLFSANGVMFASWAASIPRFADRLHLSPAQIAIATFTISLGAIVVMPFIGRLVEHRGARPIALAAAGLSPLLLPFVVEAQLYASILIFGALFGAAIGSMDVAINAYAVAAQREADDSWLGQMHGFWSIGNVAGSLLIAALLAWGVGAPGVVNAFVTVAMTIAAAALMVTVPAQKHEAGKPRAFRVLILLGTLAALSLIIEGAMSDWGALYLHSGFHVSNTAAVLAYAIFAGTMMIARFTGDWFVLLRGRAAAFSASSVVATIGLIVALTAQYPAIVMLGYAIIGFGCGNLIPILYGAAGNVAGASGVAVVSAIAYTAFLVGPAIIGATAQLIGLHAALWIVACCAAATTLAALPQNIRNHIV